MAHETEKGPGHKSPTAESAFIRGARGVERLFSASVRGTRNFLKDIGEGFVEGAFGYGDYDDRKGNDR